MGSLRTPIGPLPSSIYWRRRVVVLLILLILGALVFWGLRDGDSSPAASSADDSAGGGPAPSITPGATDTESHIDERPGGSDSTDDDGDDDGDDDPDGGDSAGDSSADDGKNGGGPGHDGDGADPGGWEGVAGGSEAGSGLPDCTDEQLTIALSSNENDYSPDEEPTLRLALTNASTAACAADIGDDVLTVLLTTENDEVWNSSHCPENAASYRLEVPAQTTVGHTIDWDRRYSDREQCEGPKPPSAPYGTYLAEATMAGFDVVQTTFRLAED